MRVPTLNIKNERVYELARELSAATGESMTGAIETALTERLERVRHKVHRRDERRAAELEELLDAMADRFGPVEGDPTAFLYDEETGLPRGD
jgi:antitoxin VapB